MFVTNEQIHSGVATSYAKMGVASTNFLKDCREEFEVFHCGGNLVKRFKLDEKCFGDDRQDSD